MALHNDPRRGRIMGAGELRLHDWFVPVLYQEEVDPQLFARLPGGEASRLQEQRRRLALGDCLRDLGRLDEAAAAYEQAIQLDEQRGAVRDVAVGKFQLATVRLLQRRYGEALAAYQEARNIFERLGEPGSVAAIWRQIGMVHRKAGEPEAAERAYRQSLAIKVQQGNRSGQASSLGELGNLYGELGRLEEAVAFYRQAADIAVELNDSAKEGIRRSNIAATLVRLRRYDEARAEALRAIECKQPFGHAAEPWTTWAILHDIETASGDAAAAQAAWQQARDHYLAYRRDGGYAQTSTGELCDRLLQSLQADDQAGAAHILVQAEAAGWSAPLLAALQAIVEGAGDPALGDDPALDYASAAEVVWLVARLG
jgi:tetratricopeptide (TPR) repeat protein